MGHKGYMFSTYFPFYRQVTCSSALPGPINKNTHTPPALVTAEQSRSSQYDAAHSSNINHITVENVRKHVSCTIDLSINRKLTNNNFD